MIIRQMQNERVIRAPFPQAMMEVKPEWHPASRVIQFTALKFGIDMDSNGSLIFWGD